MKDDVDIAEDILDDNYVKSSDDYKRGWDDGFSDGIENGTNQMAEIAQMIIEKWKGKLPDKENNILIIKDLYQGLKTIADEYLEEVPWEVDNE